MPRTTLEPQDAVLVRLGLWPYPGRGMKDLAKAERPLVYQAREALSAMISPVRLPGHEDRKYRTQDVERLIENSTIKLKRA